MANVSCRGVVAELFLGLGTETTWNHCEVSRQTAEASESYNSS